MQAICPSVGLHFHKKAGIIHLVFIIMRYPSVQRFKPVCPRDRIRIGREIISSYSYIVICNLIPMCQVHIDYRSILRRLPRHMEYEIPQRVKNMLFVIDFISLQDMRMHPDHQVDSTIYHPMGELYLVPIRTIDKLIAPMYICDPEITTRQRLDLRLNIPVFRQRPIQGSCRKMVRPLAKSQYPTCFP